MIIKDIFSTEITYIALDILFGSLMAFTGVLAYGRIKKISLLFVVVSSLFLYISMVFRVLDILNIFVLKQVLVSDVPIYFYIQNYFPSIFMFIAFIIIINEK